jgi:hypothetical protein
MATFKELLKTDPINIEAVSAHLDALDHDVRVQEIYAIGGGQQKRLFAAAEGQPKLGLDYFVPADKPAKTFVRHYGKNSLPAFSRFEKRFARPEEKPDQMWGFNFGPAMGLVGPGHFVLRDGSERHPEMHVDYYSLPEESFEGAPPLKENTAGISTLVYGNMIDVLRRVSEHVTIGRAIKKGKETGNYFLLCRET